MSVSEGRQIERRPNRFTITWAQLIVKFMTEWIVEVLQIRYTLTFQSVCCQKVITSVHRADPSSIRSPVFGWVEAKWCDRCVAVDGRLMSRMQDVLYWGRPVWSRMADDEKDAECPSTSVANTSNGPLQSAALSAVTNDVNATLKNNRIINFRSYDWLVLWLSLQ